MGTFSPNSHSLKPEGWGHVYWYQQVDVNGKFYVPISSRTSVFWYHSLRVTFIETSTIILLFIDIYILKKLSCHHLQLAKSLTEKFAVTFESLGKIKQQLEKDYATFTELTPYIRCCQYPTIKIEYEARLKKKVWFEQTHHCTAMRACRSHYL